MADPKDTQFLSRWSRRKLAAREPLADQVGLDQPPQTTSEVGVADEQAAAIAAHEAELKANREAAEAVDLSTLDEKSDISIFMKKGVPELLRRQALALLWRSNPVFANVDGLVDYGEDFGRPELIMKTFTSAWQAGRGYLKEEIVEEEGDPAATDNAATADADKEPPATDAATGDEPTEATAADMEIASLPPVSEETAIPMRSEEASAELVVTDIEPEPEMPRVSLRRRLMLDHA